jgi:pimeloyl-ACP methyl ester carboxylesterase
MYTVASADGTTIAFDQLGEGLPIILVGGAFSYRAFPKLVELTELLAERFTVINYDRRGRGGSGDTEPYSVDRELDDLQALIDAAGGSASLWGWSSGGVLALRAAAAGMPVERLAVYEPPFTVDDSGHLPPADFDVTLAELTAAGRRGAAAGYFLRKGMGIPTPFVAMMRITPFWSKLKATALTLPYDVAVMDCAERGKPLGSEQWASVTMPTLVLAGEKSPAQLQGGARALAGVLPNAHYRALEGQSHNVSMGALAPVLAEFYAGHARGDRGQVLQSNTG